MQQTYTILFDRIIAGEYNPDTRLKEEALAQEFGVSRTPIREVLRQLEQDGLVEILQNKGARIIGFTADDVEEIYEIRKSLELLCLDVAVPVLSIDALMTIRREIVGNLNVHDFAVHTALDAKLHNYFIEASNKRRLISMLKQLFRLIQSFRELGFQDPKVRETAEKEHLNLIDALCIRDLTAAKDILARHIQTSTRTAISHLMGRR